MPANDLLSLNDVNMPSNVEAEQAVLGSILVDPSCLHQVTVIISNPEYFYLTQHQKIFSVMLAIDARGQKIDPLVIVDSLVSEGVFDPASGKKYLYELAQTVPTTENVEMYARLVKDKYFKRSLINVCAETVEQASNQDATADELLDNAEQKIYNIRQGKTNDAPQQLYSIIINNVYDTLNKLSGEDKEKYKGYTTGFSDLDKVITGLNRSDLIIIGARPAMGKTSFALNLARNISLIAKRKVLFFSLEMTKEQLASRVLATEARVSSAKMRTGNISEDESIRLGNAAGVLKDAELYFDDSSMITVPEMKAKARRLGGVECIIIDYLGLIKSSVKAENRVNEVSEITRNLKNMAKDLNIPIICCAQLSRVTEGRGKSHRPQLADLRDSGSIEQDADIVMMLYREDYYKGESADDNSQYQEDEASVNKVTVIVAKNRHGITDDVDFVWDKEHTLFVPIEKVRDDS